MSGVRCERPYGLRLIIVIAAIVSPVWLSLGAAAETCEDISFPDRTIVDGTDLVLNGMGIRKVTMLGIHVYVAGLYLAQHESDADTVLDDNGVWQVRVEFVRSVSAEEILDTWTKALRDTGADIKEFAPQIGQLNGLIEDVEAGQSLTFSHEPGDGLLIESGDRRQLIKGDDFARAVLAIWLGPHPPDGALKKGLLGGPCV